MSFVRKVKTINKPRFLFIIGNHMKKKKNIKNAHTETGKKTNKQKQSKTKQAENTRDLNKKPNKTNQPQK